MSDNTLYKIWFIEFDENGNEVTRGVYPKEYKNFGNAERIAREKFGYKYLDNPKYKWEVCHRDPWVTYSHLATCPICGNSYDRPENIYGWDRGNNIYLGYGHRKYNSYKPCDDCMDAFDKFIEERKKGSDING